MIDCFQKMITLSLSLQGLLFFTQYQTITVSSYCTGYLRNRDIAGIWRLTSKQSFLPKLPTTNHLPNVKWSYPLKEFTVYPKDKPSSIIDTSITSSSSSKSGNDAVDRNQEEDIMLLLREDGTFVQYASSDQQRERSDDNETNDPLFAVYEMKGSWKLVDGKLILAAERPKDVNNIRSEGHHHDTILEGRIVAVSDTSLVDNPALSTRQQTVGENQQQQEENNGNSKSVHHLTSGNSEKTEDVHLSVPKGKVKVGKFFYPLNHPSFFEQPIFSPTSTGFFELRQVLGTLNTHIQHDEDKFVEKFRKKDLMDKRYFITSYPLPTAERKNKRWSIKYNKYVGKSVI